MNKKQTQVANIVRIIEKQFMKLKIMNSVIL